MAFKYEATSYMCGYSSVPVLVSSLEPGKISFVTLKRNENKTKKSSLLIVVPL